MNYLIIFINNALGFLLVILFFVTCEDNIIKENRELDQQDTLAIVDTVRFEDINNLLQQKCYHCHSEQEYSFYDLNLDSYENVMVGSQNGPVAIPYEPNQSLLYTKCSGEHSEGERMPQDELTYFDEHPDKLQLIYDWIIFGCVE